jgi:hypothetical protein
MATYNIGLTGQTAAGIPWQGSNRVGVIEIVVDLSRRLGTNVPSGGYVTGDVLQVADLPAGTHVLGGALTVLTAEGAAATAALATTGTAITLLSATTVNSTAGTVVAFTGTGVCLVASKITVTLGGTLSGTGVAKFVVSATVANYGYGGQGGF